MNENDPKLGGLKKLGGGTTDDLKIEPPSAKERTSSLDAPPILTVNSSDAQQPVVRQKTLDESAHQDMEGSQHGEHVIHPSSNNLDQTFDDFSAPSLASLSSAGPETASVPSNLNPSAPPALNIEPPKENKSKLKLATKKTASAAPAATPTPTTPDAKPSNPCPACGASRQAGAVFCLECGYNDKTGQKVAAEQVPNSLHLKENKSVNNSSPRPTKRAPNHQLLAVFRFIICGLAAAGAVYYFQVELWPKLFGFSESVLKENLTDAQFTIAQNYYELSLIAVAAAAAWAGSLVSNLVMKSPYRSYISAVFISFIVITLVSAGLMFQTVKQQDKNLIAYSEAYLKNFATEVQRLWVDGPEPKQSKELESPYSYTGTVTYSGIDGDEPKKKAWQIECSTYEQVIDSSLELTKKEEKKKFQQQALNVYNNLDFWRKKVYDKVSEK